MRNCRDEADARLVMSYIMTVIIAPLAVLAVKVSANILWSERLLNLAVTITIQTPDRLKRLRR